MPVRAMSRPITRAASAAAGSVRSAPPKRPTGVRSGSQITASRVDGAVTGTASACVLGAVGVAADGEREQARENGGAEEIRVELVVGLDRAEDLPARRA